VEEEKSKQCAMVSNTFCVTIYSIIYKHPPVHANFNGTESTFYAQVHGTYIVTSTDNSQSPGIDIPKTAK